ncbi:ABC transporter permease [Ferrimicrobium acidiphilum]|uniref:Transport permease protein n=1 Tax=Ferrimicrobium acidiphilum DSM 19497 TaxID=1121877 RepID=A0A0D8FUZ5_9ACTN|nr:ABC transporter permease [Ferrimicrobium acidiphilum]KJE77100.1 teichoic acid translocation permease protein TagG [Ferrimicrobium acidiphilum DSM 19497]
MKTDHAGATPEPSGYRRDRELPIHLVRPSMTVPQRIANIWRYRDLLKDLVAKEIKVKYKDSALGFIWSLLNPAMFILIYYIVFQKILKNGIPLFAIYLATGLLAWNLFQSGVLGATGSVVGNSGLVKKVAFPREILALASVGSAFIFFLFQTVVLAIFLVVFRVAPSPRFVWLVPLALLGLLMFACALAVLLSGVNVYLRDMQHLMEILLQAWFWATPIVYPFMELSKQLRAHGLTWLYLANPTTPVALTFQRAFYVKANPLGTNGTIVHILPNYGPMWYLAVLGTIIVLSFIFFLVSVYIFGRLEGNFAEEL